MDQTTQVSVLNKAIVYLMSRCRCANNHTQTVKIKALHCITCGHVYHRNKMPKTARSNSMSNMPQITTLMISNHSYRFVTSQGLYLPRLDVSYCKWQFALMDHGFFCVDLFLTLSTKTSFMTASALVLVLFKHLAPMVVCRPYWRSRSIAQSQQA